MSEAEERKTTTQKTSNSTTIVTRASGTSKTGKLVANQRSMISNVLGRLKDNSVFIVPEEYNKIFQMTNSTEVFEIKVANLDKLINSTNKVKLDDGGKSAIHLTTHPSSAIEIYCKLRLSTQNRSKMSPFTQVNITLQEPNFSIILEVKNGRTEITQVHFLSAKHKMVRADDALMSSQLEIEKEKVDCGTLKIPIQETLKIALSFLISKDALETKKHK